MTDKKTCSHDKSANAQRRRLLERLRLGPIDTLTIRRELSILMPAPRILELRSRNFDIQTHSITAIDENGCLHDGVALYVLIREPE